MICTSALHQIRKDLRYSTPCRDACNDARPSSACEGLRRVRVRPDPQRPGRSPAWGSIKSKPDPGPGWARACGARWNRRASPTSSDFQRDHKPDIKEVVGAQGANTGIGETRGYAPRTHGFHLHYPLIPSFFWLCIMQVAQRLALYFCGRRVHGPCARRRNTSRPFCPSPSPRDPSAPNGTPYGVL